MILDEIFEFIFESIFVFIIEVICFNTGEIIVYVLTFGKKKPRWDYIKNNKFSKLALLTETTILVGLIFWILVIIWILNSL
ncbi:MAG: hypothetical protein K8R34_13930 [Methanosarcinales archaeon]|jgi:UDP-N-acetylmuramyl pentapeptide phosphotransferase/UDP-N-acetylglucosamine-1-phosphate transferase|nr:hypothetical protein [Methanosarcinales archaeon]MCD4799590.1 hypothetical protein [Methanosarcinales archaeon]MCD4809716.1 hypothetical protein [Methanosarcinales archaeon]